MNSMKSRSVISWLGRVLKRTTLASIYMKARRRVGGHSAHCGRKSQSLGIRVGIVLRMRASFCVVHCQICGPSPHSTRRCCSVSCMPKLLHLSVGDYSIPDRSARSQSLYQLSYPAHPFSRSYFNCREKCV